MTVIDTCPDTGPARGSQPKDQLCLLVAVINYSVPVEYSLDCWMLSLTGQQQINPSERAARGC